VGIVLAALEPRDGHEGNTCLLGELCLAHPPLFPPKRKAFYGRTKAEALAKRNKALADYHAGLLVFNTENPSVREYLERWLNDSVKHRVKVTTFESYSTEIHRHVVPTLGRLKLNKLTAMHLQNLYSTKQNDGLSPRTVDYLHGLIKQALKQAHRWGLVAQNVAEAVDPPRQQRKEMKCLSHEQARRLLKSVRGDRLEALYVLAVTAGLRQGELLGLKWEDVDFEAKTLSVRRTLSAAKEGPIFTTPKSAKSRRRLTLTESAVEALKGHRERQSEEKVMVGGTWRDQDLVFCSVVGTPMSRHNLHNRSFKPLLKRAGLPNIRFHDLRHTCATLLLKKGTHPKIVQELLGHATVFITLDTYSHVLPGMDGEAAAGMEDLLS
jgi:integrase